MRPICISVLLVAYIDFAFQQNVETRSVGLVKPSGSGYQYGVGIAITNTSTASVLFIGAPKYGNSSQGALFRCEIDPTNTSGVTTCNERVKIDKGGSLGISLGNAADKNQVIACAPKYSYQCPNSTGDPWLMGACYATNTTTVKMANPFQADLSCTNSSRLKVDIMFVVDESGSVGRSNYRKALRWIKSVAKGFESSINVGDVRVGMVNYGTTERLSISLEKRKAVFLYDLVLKTSYASSGYTFTDKGINATTKEFKSVQTGNNIPRLMIVMTDGQSAYANLVEDSAKNARAANITIVSVGIGSGIDEDELLTIAGLQEHVLKVSNFDTLSQILSKLTKVIKQTASFQLEGTVSNATSELTNGQLGFSIHASQSGAAIVGSVGSYDRAGSIALYTSLKDAFPKFLNLAGLESITNPENITHLRDAYLGYSITSGRLLGGTNEYIISGSPRYRSKGQVLILNSSEIEHPSSLYYTLHPHGKMWQLGGYFGHSVLCLDVNGDSYDDLLVSSPLYSEQISFDQGRVFVYINDPTNPGPQQWKSRVKRFTILRGKNRARLGMSMASAGDVDRNGYNDVIIGAPGEDMTSSSSGSVYVYYGSASGLSHTNKQRIKGSSVAPSLVNFGYAIANGPREGADVDNNRYPDVVVGAPSSDTVVILRSRPIIDVNAEVILSSSSIDVIRCLNDVTSVCATFMTCVRGSERSDEEYSYHDLVTRVSLDSLQIGTEIARITLVGKDTTDASQVQYQNLTSTRSCRSYNVTLNAVAFQNKESMNTPIRITFSYDFSTEHKNGHLSAIFDPTSSNEAQADWLLDNGCSGNQSTCVSDLTLDVVYTIPSSNDPYVMQSGEEVLTITVTIGNLGPDHVSTAWLEVLSPVVELSRVKSTCADLSSTQSMSGKAVLVLKSAASLLYGRKKCQVELIYSLEPLSRSASISNLTIGGQLFSAQKQTYDPNPSNNEFRYQRKLKYDVNLEITSRTSQQVFIFNHSTSRPIIHSIRDPLFQNPLKHTYTIYNTGANILSSALLTFKWMEQTKNMFQLLYLYDFVCSPATKCVCKSEGIINKLGIPLNNDTTFKHSLHFPKPSEVTLPAKPTCEDVICETIRCHVTNLDVFSSLSIEASFVVWIPSLAAPDFNSDFTSSLSVNTSASPVTPTDGYYSKVSTLVQAYQPPKKVDKEENGLNLGVIIGATIGALVFLALLVVLLWKLGFFKSKYKERLDNAKDASDDQPRVEEIAEE